MKYTLGPGWVKCVSKWGVYKFKYVCKAFFFLIAVDKN